MKGNQIKDYRAHRSSFLYDFYSAPLDSYQHNVVREKRPRCSSEFLDTVIPFSREAEDNCSISILLPLQMISHVKWISVDKGRGIRSRIEELPKIDDMGILQDLSRIILLIFEIHMIGQTLG